VPWIAGPARSGDPVWSVADASLIGHELGWRPTATAARRSNRRIHSCAAGAVGAQRAEPFARRPLAGLLFPERLAPGLSAHAGQFRGQQRCPCACCCSPAEQRSQKVRSAPGLERPHL